jgi:hypothetical protein
MRAGLKKVGGDPDSAAERASAGAQGRRHGAIVTQGLTRMDPYGKDSFRGEGLTLAELNAKYPKGKAQTFTAFQSTSWDPAIADIFMRQEMEQDKPEMDQNNKPTGKKVNEGKVGVYVTYKDTAGRDVSQLSALPHEHEVLIPPGAKMLVDSVTPRPGAKNIYDVVLKQTG